VVLTSFKEKQPIKFICQDKKFESEEELYFYGNSYAVHSRKDVISEDAMKASAKQLAAANISCSKLNDVDIGQFPSEKTDTLTETEDSAPKIEAENITQENIILENTERVSRNGLKSLSTEGMFSVFQERGHNMSPRVRKKQNGRFLNPKYRGYLEIVESSQMQKNLVTLPGQQFYFCLDFLSRSCYEKNFFKESTPIHNNLEPCMFWFRSVEQYNILKRETEGVYLQSREFQEKLSQLVSGIIILNTLSDVKTSKVGTGVYFAVTKSKSNGIWNSYMFKAESEVEVEKWVFYTQSLLNQRFHLEKDLQLNSPRYRKGLEHFSMVSAREAFETNKEQMHGFSHKLRLSGRKKRSAKQYHYDEIFKEEYRSVKI